jgi:hypothetical protein
MNHEYAELDKTAICAKHGLVFGGPARGTAEEIDQPTPADRMVHADCVGTALPLMVSLTCAYSDQAVSGGRQDFCRSNQRVICARTF